jgi:hypothetical protein
MITQLLKKIWITRKIMITRNIYEKTDECNHIVNATIVNIRLDSRLINLLCVFL